MRRAERIIVGLAALGEPAEAPLLAQRADAVAAAGDDLVGIALVAHVPDQLVIRRVEDRVDRDGQLDDAKRRPEVPAGDGHGADRLGAQLVGALGQFGIAQAAEVGGVAHTVENGGMRPVGDVFGHSSVLPNQGLRKERPRTGSDTRPRLQLTYEGT
jgi:hypothetical protein